MGNTVVDTPASEAAVGTVGSYRDALPNHFTFKIQSFSRLKTTAMDIYESNDFVAGGYKWKLVFYPNGNNTTTTTSKSTTHVSMYLKIVDTNSLPRGWTVDVSFRFFVLDQIRDKYFILGDTGGTTRRFHEMKTMWGYEQLLPLTTLNDSSSNGYIVDDACVFGAEVFPIKNTGCGDCLTIVRLPSCVKYTWKIENFSKKKEEIIYSDEFVSEGYKWKMRLYPKGDSLANKENFSLYLELSGSTNTVELAGEQVYARFKYLVKDQLYNLHRELAEDQKWFNSSGKSWGRRNFMTLGELNDKSKGYLVKDTCIVEAEVTVLGVAKRLS